MTKGYPRMRGLHVLFPRRTLERQTLPHDTDVMHRHERMESRRQSPSGDALGVAKIQLLDLCSSLHSRGGAWMPLHDVSSGACTKKIVSVEHAEG